MCDSLSCVVDTPSKFERALQWCDHGNTDVLRLVDQVEIDADSAAKISAADAIYAGGGDTGYMLETRQTRSIDDLLREAWQNGTVLVGLSAGATP